jgi:SAM-dependent methyltransferase
MGPRLNRSPGRLAHEIAHHDAIAPRAEIVWNWASPSGRRRVERRASFFVEQINAIPGLRALEIGCGSGVFLARTLASGGRVVAVDLSLTMIETLRARLGQVTSDGLRLLCADAERLPFRDASFDVVYGSSVLHHLDLPVALREIHRVLRAGGRLVFAEPNLLNPHVALQFRVLPRAWSSFSPDEQAFSRFRARRLLRAAGFVEVSSEPYDFLHPLVPAPLIDMVASLSLWLERIPVLREIAGSQLLKARKP